MCVSVVIHRNLTAFLALSCYMMKSIKLNQILIMTPPLRMSFVCVSVALVAPTFFRNYGKFMVNA